jgi:hypothetical protein
MRFLVICLQSSCVVACCSCRGGGEGMSVCNRLKVCEIW